ncbi:MAG: D-glycero-beta-D-manno-heptose 1-phosphate adenylyltransferase [Deltaproteobacteria bacterium]|nr:MAG: D-glycero-beta-D-manno-heptose 1-phosphate adenylyltransferase [Deltaproteobacteria bacterium]
MRPLSSKIKGREELTGVLARLRSEGKRVVFTNGCFDLLHLGHVTYLEEARGLGDLLVVGVNTDESVRRIKGPGRPIVPLEQRMAVLAALEAVDYVVPFGEDTPYELIKALRPHVLVKGGDWRPEEVVGQDLVEEVRIVPYREGFSTTGLIEKIKKG